MILKVMKILKVASDRIQKMYSRRTLDKLPNEGRKALLRHAIAAIGGQLANEDYTQSAASSSRTENANDRDPVALPPFSAQHLDQKDTEEYFSAMGDVYHDLHDANEDSMAWERIYTNLGLFLRGPS